ncbi:response regulator receiver sensor signal transduction histidine kinase [Calothrix sp. NIES-4071]|nr:response regulator receiver sensor signal transduction histidine kinase [Calothrix sp. NIES-4071]BAZ56813.1 response regulator receiver sensor signal transduction histidine kinase [Calothrix sp. NIES-4105]
MQHQQVTLILIIDDTPANLDVIYDTLNDAGYEVAIANSGERAFKQMQFQLPDLILLDVMMPVMDGFEVCRRLKTEPSTKEIPVIFMTALSDTESKTKGFDLGAVDYITKPFQEAEVVARIKTHLQLRYLTKNLEQQVTQRTGELVETLQELQSSHMQLIQNEKMSALGNLVAGIAHEINNPIGFVHGNVNHVEGYTKDLLNLMKLYQQRFPQPGEDIEAEIEAIDLEYLQEDLPKLINSTQEGIKRIRNISTSLRTFSRADSEYPTEFNIHEGLDSTILILKHRLKADENRPAIEVVYNYGNIPQVECYAGQLNQVFMNLLANAIDALEESNRGKSFEQVQANPNLITITTELSQDNQSVLIRIKDNGIGMSDEVKDKAFEHLFTTKGVGKGTGLGLAIARQIIVDKHHGSIDINSSYGEGTEFVITIPIRAKL